MKSSTKRPVRASKSPSRVAAARAASRKAAPKSAKRSPARPKEAKIAVSRKSTRILGEIASQGMGFCQTYFEAVSPDEIVRIFDESYSATLVNTLLDLKKSTAKRIFEVLVQAKKRACLDVITLYYYKEYLLNPLPLSLESIAGQEVPNYYAILGIPRETTPEELKVAEKLLMSACDPDRFPPSDRKVWEERLREIHDAFEVLRNPKRRKELDGTLPNISYLYPRRDQSWFEAVNRIIV